MEAGHIFHGSFIHPISENRAELIESGLLVVDQNGRITSVEKRVEAKDITKTLSSLGVVDQQAAERVKILKKGQFLIPGFVDTHNHAPQWGMRGLGRGLQILEWLDTITFPNESKFKDTAYASKVYDSCVDGFIKQGVTTASYYGSLHGPASKILADICLAKGQRAFVGKCNMNRNSPTYYRDSSTEESLEVTEDFIKHVRTIDPLFQTVRPILTPRFAISCEPELLAGLGQMAARNPDIPIQTHFNEAESEIAATLSLFPQFSNEADLYEHYGLLTDRSILAHCTHMTEYEFTRLEVLKCGVAHCPIANTTVGGGFMAAPIRECLRRGIKVGLGTDSGGGFSSSMLDAMRQAFIVSNAREMITKGADPNLSLHECFYLATLGGAKVCGLDKEIGNFEVGKQFDALVINTVDHRASSVVTIIEKDDSLDTIFEKFLMTGDDRNISEVYVRGRLIKT
jgi:guanine deaminase